MAATESNAGIRMIFSIVGGYNNFNFITWV